MALIKGMDLSTLREVEACGGRFSDENGPGDAMTILRRHGMDLVRLRLWNDPYAENGEPYGAGTCDLETVTALARRAKALGCKWMLDFHYSDFWADPGKQITPKAWQGLDADGLEKAVYEFTREALEKLKAEDLAPDMVSVGNEITNGLLWPVGRASMDNIVRFVNAGLQAVEEVCPRAETVIHLDNGPDEGQYRAWFESYFAAGGRDFDIVGMSYYPFWNGPMSGLAESMADEVAHFGKDIIIAETSMGFSLADYAAYEKLGPGERKGMAAKAALAAGIDYPMTPQGQSDFIRDMAEIIRAVPGGKGRGFIWWEAAWIPVPGSGWARPAALRYTGEKGPGGNEWANQALFDYEGRALPALETIRAL